MKKLQSIAFLKLTCLNYNSKRYYNTKQTLRTCLGFVYFYFLMFCFKTKQLKVQKNNNLLMILKINCLTLENGR